MSKIGLYFGSFNPVHIGHTAIAGYMTEYAGLDQVNLGPLPRSLAGKGATSVVLRVDGKTSNAVTVNIR